MYKRYQNVHCVFLHSSHSSIKLKLNIPLIFTLNQNLLGCSVNKLTNAATF